MIYLTLDISYGFSKRALAIFHLSVSRREVNLVGGNTEVLSPQDGPGVTTIFLENKNLSQIVVMIERSMVDLLRSTLPSSCLLSY